MFRKVFMLSFVLFLFYCSKAQKLFNDRIDVEEGKGLNYQNAVLYFPANYPETKKYPLVIFTHGIGEAGTDVNKLYRQGLPKILKDGYRPSFDFIVVAPQSTSFRTTADWLPGIVEAAKQRWKINTNRLYLTGISAGGKSIYGTQLSLTTAAASKFVAIAKYAGVMPASARTNFNLWAKSKTPLLAVVGASDRSYVTKNTYIVKEVSSRVPGLASLTLLPGVGHTA